MTEAALALPCLPGAHGSVGETNLSSVEGDPECAELEWGSPQGSWRGAREDFLEEGTSEKSKRSGSHAKARAQVCRGLAVRTLVFEGLRFICLDCIG